MGGWLLPPYPNWFNMNEIALGSISYLTSLLPHGTPSTRYTESSVTGIDPLPGNSNSHVSGLNFSIRNMHNSGCSFEHCISSIPPNCSLLTNSFWSGDICGYNLTSFIGDARWNSFFFWCCHEFRVTWFVTDLTVDIKNNDYVFTSTRNSSMWVK